MVGERRIRKGLLCIALPIGVLSLLGVAAPIALIVGGRTAPSATPTFVLTLRTLLRIERAAEVQELATRLWKDPQFSQWARTQLISEAAARQRFGGKDFDAAAWEPILRHAIVRGDASAETENRYLRDYLTSSIAFEKYIGPPGSTVVLTASASTRVPISSPQSVIQSLRLVPDVANIGQMVENSVTRMGVGADWSGAWCVVLPLGYSTSRVGIDVEVSGPNGKVWTFPLQTSMPPVSIPGASTAFVRDATTYQSLFASLRCSALQTMPSDTGGDLRGRIRFALGPAQKKVEIGLNAAAIADFIDSRGRAVSIYMGNVKLSPSVSGSTHELGFDLAGFAGDKRFEESKARAVNVRLVPCLDRLRGLPQFASLLGSEFTFSGVPVLAGSHGAGQLRCEHGALFKP